MRAHRIALGSLLAGTVAVLLWNTRGQALYADEWAFFLRAADLSAETVFASHAGNLIAAPTYIYAALFGLFGAGEYLPLRILWALLAAGAGLLTYLIARRRLGEWAALAPAAVVCLLGVAWEVTGGPLGLTIALTTCAGLGMLLLLERRDLPGDAGAALLLGVALASYSAGIAFAAGAAVELATRGRDGLRRAWVVGMPLLLYAGWRVYALRFDDTDVTLANVLSAPGPILSSLSAAAAAAAGTFRDPAQPMGVTFDPATGRVLAALLIVAAVARFAVRRRWPLERRVWVYLAMPLAYWGAIAANLGPGRGIESSRYQYLGAILVLLAAVQLASGWRPGRRGLAVLGAALAIALAGNLAQLRDAGRMLRENGEQNRAQLAALELVAQHADRAAPVEPLGEEVTLFEDMLIATGDYLDASREQGSPAMAPELLPALRESARQRADAQLVHSLRPRPVRVDRPAGAGAAPAVEGVVDGAVAERGGCVGFRPVLDDAIVQLQLPSGGFRVSSRDPEAGLRLRRFGDRYVVGIPAPEERSPHLVAIPADAHPAPWHLELTASAPVRICPP